MSVLIFSGQVTMGAMAQANRLTQRYAKHASLLILFAASFFPGCGSSGRANADAAISAPTVGVVKDYPQRP